jgi:ankyrin repeat protein
LPESPSHPPPTETELALLKAAYAGDLGKVQSLATNGTNVNAQSNEFYDMGAHWDVTPLMCAAAQGHLDIVRWLLGSGANHAAETQLTKYEGGPGTQALHFAAAGGHEAVVVALLDAGANPNAEGRLGRTPLTAALGQGKLACAKLLLSRGASPSAKSKHKQFDPPLVVLTTAISNTTSLVARNGKLVPAGKDYWDQKDAVIELIQALLAAGADPNAHGSSRQPPLASLARRIPEDVSLPIARILIESGANPDVVAGKNADSPLMTAVLYNSAGFARLLLEQPAAVDVNRLCPRGTILDVVESNIATAQRDIAQARTEDARAELEATLRGLGSLRDLLISRGAKHKSELDVPAEPPPKPEKRHIASDFLKLVNTGEAEWALLAVKAPFDAVCDGYFKFAKAKTRQQNVPVRPAGDLQEVPPLTAIIQVKDSPWTIILHTIFYVRLPHLKHVTSAAKALSKSLQTRALSWSGTEETDNGHCELFDGGEKIGTANNARSIALLTKEDLLVPACYPARDGDKSWLAVEKPSLAMVERADLIGV